MNEKNDLKELIKTSDVNLPSGWVQSKISDVLRIRNGFAFKSKDYIEKGVLLVRQTNLGGKRVSIDKAKYLPGLYLEEYSNFKIKTGDILIGMSGSVGKLCIYDLKEPALQNQRTGLLEFFDESLRQWIWYYLPLLESELLKKSKGVAVQNISASQIESFPVPIAPVNEQKRIVAEIEKQFSRLDEAVENLQRVKANLKRYKASVLKAAVEGKLTEQWRAEHPDVEPASQLLERILKERRKKWEENELARMKAKGQAPKDDKWKKKYKEPLGLNATEYLKLPSGWAWTRLEQLGEIIGGLTKNKKRELYDKKVPYLRVANVYANNLDLSEIKKIGVVDEELDRVLLEKDDLLVVEGNGSRDQIGRLAIWDGSVNPCAHQNHLIKVRLTEPEFGKFILWWLLSISGRRCVVDVASSTSGLYTLSLSKVGNLPIPLPPIEEQRVISSEVGRLITLEAVIEDASDKNWKRAGRLRQSILKKAFSGKLIKDG